MTLRLRPLVLACATALALPSILLVPEREAHGVPCAASVEEARRHMDRGLELYDRDKFREAAAEFDAAYQAQPFSASLCNAAMAYERALDFKSAIARYRSFLSAEPNPPDLVRIKTVLTWLEAQHAAQLQVRPLDSDGGAPDAAALDGGADAAVEPTNAGAPPPPVVEIRSQVVVESDPPGAPLSVYLRKAGAAAFVTGGANPGWQKVLTGEKTPHDISLAAGEYHIVLEAFRDLKRSETDLELRPGRVYTFKANLSQGAFLGFLRVTSPVEGARIHVDDPPPFARGTWGRAPHGDMLEPGEHRVWIEASGYETRLEKVSVQRGETVEL
ncbi:MAG: PEGA domain-containing protein, partial [Byssovorax sp.]